METAVAAAMLEAGVGRFLRAPALAGGLLAEMWAPLAVALAALATLPSLLRRLQVIVLRLRSRGKEVIQSHISTYYSSGDDDSGDEDEDEDDDDSSGEASPSSSGDEDGGEVRRIGYYEGAAADGGGGFPWGGAVVRTWQQALPRRVPAGGWGPRLAAPVPAVRLWGATTASGGDPWCMDGAGTRGEASASAVVLGWRRDHAAAPRSRRHQAERNGEAAAAVAGDGNTPRSAAANGIGSGQASSQLEMPIPPAEPTCQWKVRHLPVEGEGACL